MKNFIRVKSVTDLKVGMLDVGGGNFSSEMEDLSQVRSIVAAIFPDENRAIGICPVQRELPWCYTALGVVTRHIISGREASDLLRREAEKRDVILPALELCLNYENAWVKRGEAFLPTHHELRRIAIYYDKIFSVLKCFKNRILIDTLLSSSVNESYFVWVQGLGSTYSHYDYQCRNYGVCPVVDIVLS